MSAKVAELVKNWAGTSNAGLRKDGRIDKRKFSKDDLDEAWVMGILNKDGTFPNCAYCYPSIWKTEVLWCLLAEAIKTNTGFSLASNRVWRNLGFWENGHKYHNDQMLQEMEHVLIALDLAGYIRFNSAGSLWSIAIR